MSLINKMLQDLDNRHASGIERGALPDQVRAAPPRAVRRGRWWIVAALALATIALSTWHFIPLRVSLGTFGTFTTAHASINSRFADASLQRGALDAAATAASAPRKIAVAEPTASGPPPMAPASIPSGGGPGMPPVAQTALNAPLPSSPSATAAASAPPLTVAAVLDRDPQSAAIPGAPVAKAPVAATPGTARPLAAPAATGAADSAKPNGGAGRKPVSGADAKALLALANPQINKHTQVLTSQQLAENEYRNAANLLGQGRLADAQEGFRRALQQEPRHIGARQGLFGLFMEAGQTTEAEHLLREGLDLDPNRPAFAMALARLQVERGDIAAAVDTMQTSAPAARDSPDYLAFHAALLQRLARHREAIEQYQAALAMAPGSGLWQMGRAISLQALNRNTEAADAFRRAKAANTLNAELTEFVNQRLAQLK